jgi:hypothetical protein
MGVTTFCECRASLAPGGSYAHFALAHFIDGENATHTRVTKVPQTQ